MKPLSDFLKISKRLQPPQKTVIDAFIECVSDVSGVTIKASEIKLSKEAIYVKTSSVVRSEILLKQSLILKQLRQKLGEKNTSIKYLN